MNDEREGRVVAHHATKTARQDDEREGRVVAHDGNEDGEPNGARRRSAFAGEESSRSVAGDGVGGRPPPGSPHTHAAPRSVAGDGVGGGRT